MGAAPLCGVFVPNFMHKDMIKSFSFSLFMEIECLPRQSGAISLTLLHDITMYYILEKFFKIKQKVKY